MELLGRLMESFLRWRLKTTERQIENTRRLHDSVAERAVRQDARKLLLSLLKRQVKLRRQLGLV